MLSIELRDRRYFAPVIVCDHCQKPIENAKQGNYEWKSGPDGVVDPRIYFTHKACCRAFEAANPAQGWMWFVMELQVLPLYLERNLEIDPKHAREYARSMAQL